MTALLTFFLLLIFFCYEGHATLYLNIKHTTPAHTYAQDAEKRHGIPENLLTAIAHVESKCSPYAVNARGRGHYFKTQDEAVDFVHHLRNQGVRNINVGYMQINVPSHINKIGSIRNMLDLKKNIDFAAALLAKLHRIYGSWPRAVERYKSNFCYTSKQYQERIFRIMTTIKIPKNLGEKHVLSSIEKKTKHHHITLHTGGLQHTAHRIDALVPTVIKLCVKEDKLQSKPKRQTLKTIQSVTLSDIAHHKAPALAWEKTYYFDDNARHNDKDLESALAQGSRKKSIFKRVLSSLLRRMINYFAYKDSLV